MLNKLNLPVLVTIMCLLLAGVMGLAVLNQGNLTKTLFQKTKKINQDIGTTEVLVTRTDYSQTSRKILDWLDNQKDNTGWYILERGCNVDTKTCDTIWNNQEGNQDGLIVTWSRFNFYQQTKNPQDLDIIINDINKFYDKYPNGVTNSLWICKITYDMWNSNLFDQPTKDKLEQICFKTQFPTPEEIEKYWSSGTKAKEVEKIYQKSLSLRQETWNNYTLSLRGFDANFGYTTDLLTKYVWKNEMKYLNEAKKYLEMETKIYQMSISASGTSEVKDPENVCLLGISLMDMYRLTKGDSSLVLAKEIFEEQIMHYKTRKDYVTTICGLFGKEIYQETQDKNYLEILEMNNRVLEDLSLDGNNVQVLNDGAFFRSDGKKFFSYYKNIAENGLAAELFRD